MESRIEICGAIASGKSTAADALGALGYGVIHERFEDNPFLAGFYKDEKHGNAFETETVFMLLHSSLIRVSRFEKAVCDYSMFQDYCYGVQNLCGAALSVFKGTYDYLMGTIGEPHLVVYLRCGTDCLLHRINERNRGMEAAIKKDYLERNIRIMEDNLGKAGNVLVIDSQECDFRTGAGLEAMLAQVKEAISRL